jgi:transposase-like protein
VGGCLVDRAEDWLHARDAEEVGPTSGAGRGHVPGLTTTERERFKELEREVRELRRANEILKKASTYFAQAELDRRPR